MNDEEWVVIDRHWSLTADRDRVVPEDDPDARTLHWVPGTRVRRAEAERLGAFASGEASRETGQEPMPESKRRRAPTSKQRTPDADK
jgi:hypothetical protein